MKHQLFNSLRWPIYTFNLVDKTKLPQQKTVHLKALTWYSKNQPTNTDKTYWLSVSYRSLSESYRLRYVVDVSELWNVSPKGFDKKKNRVLKWPFYCTRFSGNLHCIWTTHWDTDKDQWKTNDAIHDPNVWTDVIRRMT